MNVVLPSKQPVRDMGVVDRQSSQHLVKSARSNELFVAIVAPAGSGAGTAADIITGYLEQQTVDGIAYRVHRIKASDAIRNWASANDLQAPPKGTRKNIESVTAMQDLGDRFRRDGSDGAAVSRAMLDMIRNTRARESGNPPGHLDGKPRAYVIDSLRHPAEVHLLRKVYQDAFTLVGVVCDPTQRAQRLRNELLEHGERRNPAKMDAIDALMERDANAPDRFGQHVVETFHQADFFVDNSMNSDDRAVTGMNDALHRLIDLVSFRKVIRPTSAETAMHLAHSAQLRSACLSRQVGAALTDGRGTVIATGTNEVPRAGGGVYGHDLTGIDSTDHRCAFRETKFCSSNREQNRIIDAILDGFPELAASGERSELVARLRKTPLGGLLEFSRAVHAEMDAILSAARAGTSPRGGRLFVSTFPCHYCARHIVTAGIDEVQYIEPYPKSRALDLHCDAITVDAAGWIPPSRIPEGLAPNQPDAATPASGKVLFRPFVGVAPRMYDRAFTKDRDYKDKLTGTFALGEPDWGNKSDLSKLNYVELERDLGLSNP